jgi:hypothetical protein
VAGFDRPNIFPSVHPVPGEAEKQRLRLARGRSSGTGLHGSRDLTRSTPESVCQRALEHGAPVARRCETLEAEGFACEGKLVRSNEDLSRSRWLNFVAGTGAACHARGAVRKAERAMLARRVRCYPPPRTLAYIWLLLSAFLVGQADALGRPTRICRGMQESATRRGRWTDAGEAHRDLMSGVRIATSTPFVRIARGRRWLLSPFTIIRAVPRAFVDLPGGTPRRLSAEDAI